MTWDSIASMETEHDNSGCQCCYETAVIERWCPLYQRIYRAMARLGF